MVPMYSTNGNNITSEFRSINYKLTESTKKFQVLAWPGKKIYAKEALTTISILTIENQWKKQLNSANIESKTPVKKFEML